MELERTVGHEAEHIPLAGRMISGPFRAQSITARCPLVPIVDIPFIQSPRPQLRAGSVEMQAQVLWRF
jgi:hypothetical protein